MSRRQPVRSRYTPNWRSGRCPLDTFVALNLYCPSCDRFVGRAGRWTFEGADPAVWYELWDGGIGQVRLIDGRLSTGEKYTNDEIDHLLRSGRMSFADDPDASHVSAFCRNIWCRGRLCVRRDRLASQLDDMWAPGAQRSARFKPSAVQR